MTLIQSRTRSARIVLLGLGAINRRVAALLKSRGSAAVVVGVIVRRPELLRADAVPWAEVVTNASQLIALAPDLILEAASREAVSDWGEVALRSARRFVVSSASAFVDDELLRRLREVASQSGGQLVLSPGAVGGMDALSAAARLRMHKVLHRIVKYPRSWGAAVENVRDRTVLFQGSAREAAKNYPLNANVAVVCALSGIGLDETKVELVSDPSAIANRHEIHALGDFGSLTVTLENRPLQSNPKSSELAALALVRLVENEVNELVL